jgi:hypothetical protein
VKEIKHIFVAKTAIKQKPKIQVFGKRKEMVHGVSFEISSRSRSHTTNAASTFHLTLSQMTKIEVFYLKLYLVTDFKKFRVNSFS